MQGRWWREWMVLLNLKKTYFLIFCFAFSFSNVFRFLSLPGFRLYLFPLHLRRFFFPVLSSLFVIFSLFFFLFFFFSLFFVLSSFSFFLLFLFLFFLLFFSFLVSCRSASATIGIFKYFLFLFFLVFLVFYCSCSFCS